MQNFDASPHATVDPVILGSLRTAYGTVLGEISAGCGYLPPRECRRAIASGMLLHASAGESDPERLKIWGLAAIEDFEAIPLALAFGALLRQAAVAAASSDEA
jgi:hypothetical protein